MTKNRIHGGGLFLLTLALFAALCVFTSLSASAAVTGLQIDGESCDVSGDSGTASGGGFWAWDGADTLTLTDYVGGRIAIFCDAVDPVHLDIIGTVAVSGSGNDRALYSDGALAISGSGSLTVTGDTGSAIQAHGIDINIDGTVTAGSSGDAVIVSDAALTVGGGSSLGASYLGSSARSAIRAQSLDINTTGTVTAVSGSGDGINAGSIVIQKGTVFAHGGQLGINSPGGSVTISGNANVTATTTASNSQDAIYALDDITINTTGTVTADATSASGANGIRSWNGNIVIQSGAVTATGGASGSALRAQGTGKKTTISGGSLTLASDTTVANGETIEITSPGALTIQSGATLAINTGGTVTNDGTLTNAGTLKINGTLNGDNAPGGSGVFQRAVDYIDEDGAPQSANDVTQITAAGTLTAGWYYVEGPLTLSASLVVDGNVHIILLDDSHLQVTGNANNAGIAVTTGNSLTIYAQSNGVTAGQLTATGSYGAAGIGGGQGSDGSPGNPGGDGGDGGSAGTVTINGGVVTATGQGGGAGIGGGQGGSSSEVISGSNNGGAGGAGGGGGTMTINGGVVNAASSSSGAGIGGGAGGNGGNVQDGGDGGDGGAGGAGGTVTITGGVVTAASPNGTGIGGGESGHGGTAYGGGNNGDNGIGGNGGAVSITGGVVTATSDSGAGIGGGNSNGGGPGGAGGTAVIDGDTMVKTSSLAASGTLTQGVVFDGNTGTVYGNVTLPADLTIDSNKTLTIPAGAPLDLDGHTLTNHGAIDNTGGLSGGILVSNGTYSGSGSLSGLTISGSNADAPGAPTIGLVTSGSGQVSVAFTAPGSSGSFPITEYQVTSSPGGFYAAGAASPLVVTGLTNGTAYTFTVTAKNAGGVSAASAASASATPLAPVTFTAEQTGGSSGSADSTDITITFSTTVTGLTAGDITIAPDTGEVVKGALSGSGMEWYIALTSVTTEGNVSVSVADFGAFDVTTLPQTVAVYKNTYVAPTSHTITATAGANGSISPSGSVPVASGADQTFTITATSGYHIAALTVDGANVSVAGTYTFTNVTAAHIISATFAPDSTGGGSGGGGGGGAYIPPVTIPGSSTIIQTTATLKYGEDLIVTPAFNGHKLTAIKNGTTPLQAAVDYTVSGNTITLRAAYLNTLKSGEYTLTFEVSAGTNPTLTLIVGQPYTVSGGWFNDSLDLAVRRGLLDRFIIDGKIDAAQAVAREDFVAVYLQSLGIVPLAADQLTVAPFTDVSGANAAYINTAKQLGLVVGVDAAHTQFNAAGTAQRVEFFQIITNMMDQGLVKTPALDTGLSIADFSDGAQIADWAIPAANELIKRGLIVGDVKGGGGALGADGEFTVGTLAVILDRIQ